MPRKNYTIALEESEVKALRQIETEEVRQTLRKLIQTDTKEKATEDLQTALEKMPEKPQKFVLEVEKSKQNAYLVNRCLSNPEELEEAWKKAGPRGHDEQIKNAVREQAEIIKKSRDYDKKCFDIVCFAEQNGITEISEAYTKKFIEVQKHVQERRKVLSREASESPKAFDALRREWLDARIKHPYEADAVYLIKGQLNRKMDKTQFIARPLTKRK